MAAVSPSEAEVPPTPEPAEPTETRPHPEVSSAPPLTSASAAAGRRPVILDVRDLRTYFYTYDGVVKALDGVSFKIRKGETLGLVGETGCGKSVSAFSIVRLIPDPPGRIIGGQVLYHGSNLLWGIDREARITPIKNTGRAKIRRSFRRIKAGLERMSAVRGKGVSMIFQEPQTAMNPVFSVSNQLGETLLTHRGLEVCEELLRAADHVAELPAAIDEFFQTAQIETSSDQLRKAASRVGLAAQLPTVGTELYYVARQTALVGDERRREAFAHTTHRLRLSRARRSFLRWQAAMMRLKREMDDVYMAEMREGRIDRSSRTRLRALRLVLRARGLGYSIWGYRGWVRKPLRDELFWRSVQLLEGVQIANPVQIARNYPHELSGGMLQRVMIAMALCPDPDILIADEPTTALDVTIQAQILELMRDLKQRVGSSVLLITHDLAVIAEVSDRVCVMYAGQIVETSTVSELFRQPMHPYTQGLLASIPRFDRPERKLESIPGSVPNLIYPPKGCRFHPRCPYAMPICKEERPPTTLEGTDHTVACYLYKGPVAVE